VQHSTHTHAPDQRNDNILIDINGELYARSDAKISVFDSGFVLGVRRGEVWTSTGEYCLGGITRGIVLELCRAAEIRCVEKSFSLTEVYGADEAFVTGTFAGLVPVMEVDGRVIGDGRRGRMVCDLQARYRALIEQECAGRRA
jgi:hypothetical protein